jgi:hypothetical protein
VPFHLYPSCITPRPFQACAANKFCCDRSIIKGTFIWRTKSVVGCYSVSIRRLMLKIRTSLHSSHALQNLQVWFRSICNYGNLLGLHCTFSAVSELPTAGFSWEFISRTLRTCTRSGASLFATGQQVRALYMGSSVSLRLYLFFHWKYFPENSHLILPWPTFTVRTYLEAFCLLVTGEAGVSMFLDG